MHLHDKLEEAPHPQMSSKNPDLYGMCRFCACPGRVRLRNPTVRNTFHVQYGSFSVAGAYQSQLSEGVIYRNAANETQ